MEIQTWRTVRRTWGSDSKGARAHAKGRLSVFLASLDLLTSFSQGTIRRHECFGASHNRYPKLGLSNQRTTTERDHGASIDLLRRRVGQISRLSRGNPSRRPHPRFYPDRCRPGSSGQSPGGGESPGLGSPAVRTSLPRIRSSGSERGSAARRPFRRRPTRSQPEGASRLRLP